MSKVTFEDLSYLTTQELWRLMAHLKIPYCDIEDVEKENKSTGEMVTIPKFIPRTDYENMKSDIIVTMSCLGRDFRRPIELEVGKLVKKRKKLIPKEMMSDG